MAKITPQKHGGSIKILEKGETANPNGRPRKGISFVNKQLKDEGYEVATKADIEENYMSLLNLEETKLKELLDDKKQPMLIRIIVRAMLSGKGFDIIEKMLDRGIGKAKGTDEIKGNITINGLSEDDKKLLDKVINQNL